MDVDYQRDWHIQVEDFISRWENETVMISRQTLNPDECGKISEHFHRDFNGLLVRRPPGSADNDVVSRLEELNSKLGSSLAMACSWKRKDSE